MIAKIGSQFYERMALSQNKAALLEKAENSEPSDVVTPEEAIKDPFVLEFLDLKDEYSESDLEEALIHRLTDFLLELGDDFAFLGRQRRLRIDDTWFRIDLIFFHRRLHGLVIIDLLCGRPHKSSSVAPAVMWRRSGGLQLEGYSMCADAT